MHYGIIYFSLTPDAVYRYKFKKKNYMNKHYFVEGVRSAFSWSSFVGHENIASLLEPPTGHKAACLAHKQGRAMLIVSVEGNVT